MKKSVKGGYMSITSEMKTEVLSKRRILKYLGVTAKEIPHYESQKLWLDISSYENKNGKWTKAVRKQIVKNQQAYTARIEKIRHIICEFEEKQQARAYYALLTRSKKIAETEVAILYVGEKEANHWQEDRNELKSLTPMAYVCKLDNPKIAKYCRLTCTIEKGILSTKIMIPIPKVEKIRRKYS